MFCDERTDVQTDSSPLNFLGEYFRIQAISYTDIGDRGIDDQIDSLKVTFIPNFNSLDHIVLKKSCLHRFTDDRRKD